MPATNKQNVIVSSNFIKKSGDDCLFVVPDVSGTTNVNKKIALFHAISGEIVFARLSSEQQIAKR